MNAVWKWFVRVFAFCIWRWNLRIAIDLLHSTGQQEWLAQLERSVETLQKCDSQSRKVLIPTKNIRKLWIGRLLLCRMAPHNESFPHALYAALLRCSEVQGSLLGAIVRDVVAGEHYLGFEEPGPIDPSFATDWERIVRQLLDIVASGVSHEMILAVAENAGVELYDSDFLRRRGTLLKALSTESNPNQKKRLLTEACKAAATNSVILAAQMEPCFIAGIEAGLISLCVGLAANYKMQLPQGALQLAADRLLEQGQIEEAMVAIRESEMCMNALTLREYAQDHAKRGNSDAVLKLTLLIEEYAQREATEASANH